jgi:PPOX class probable F420-dependent enzyme
VSRRDQIRMTDEEIAEFLEAPRKLHVASVNRDGTPHLMPVYYAMIDGKITFWTYTKSQKIKNLERDPRLTVMVEDGDSYDQLRGVQINGVAQMTTDPAALMEIGQLLYQRYFGVFNETAQAGIEYSARKRTRVSVEPLQTASWDHRRLGGVY